MLSEQAFAAERPSKGRIRMIGEDREKGRALAEVFKRIGRQIRQIAREAGPQDDDDDGGSASDWLRASRWASRCGSRRSSTL